MARGLPMYVIATIQSARAPSMRGMYAYKLRLSPCAKIKGLFLFSDLWGTSLCSYRSFSSLLHFKSAHGCYLSMSCEPIALTCAAPIENLELVDWRSSPTKPPCSSLWPLPIVLGTSTYYPYTLPVISSPRATLRWHCVSMRPSHQRSWLCPTGP